MNLQDDLPADLYNHLLKLKGTLSLAGTILLRRDKKHPSLRLRVRHFNPELGYRKMISIKIPDDSTANQVKELLSRWRAEEESRQAALRRSAEALAATERHEKQEEAVMLRLVAAMSGGGSGVQRRVRKEFRYALNQGTVASALYVLGAEYRKCPVQRRKRVPLKEQPKGIPVGLWQPVDVQRVVRERFQERRNGKSRGISR